MKLHCYRLFATYSNAITFQPKFEGNIEFVDGSFSYPSRREARVLSDFSMAISAGQKVALVGQSGCGKSTVIQLLQRFYDLNSGMLVSFPDEELVFIQ